MFVYLKLQSLGTIQNIGLYQINSIVWQNLNTSIEDFKEKMKGTAITISLNGSSYFRSYTLVEISMDFLLNYKEPYIYKDSVHVHVPWNVIGSRFINRTENMFRIELYSDKTLPKPLIEYAITPLSQHLALFQEMDTLFSIKKYQLTTRVCLNEMNIRGLFFTREVFNEIENICLYIDYIPYCEYNYVNLQFHKKEVENMIYIPFNINCDENVKANNNGCIGTNYKTEIQFVFKTQPENDNVYLSYI